MKLLLLPLLIFFTSFLISQSKVDSLQFELKKASIDSVKVKILHQLFYEYLESSPEKAGETARTALNILVLTKDKNLQAESYNRYTDFLINQSGINELKKALDFSLPDSLKARVLNQLGNKYIYVSTDSALIYANKALTVSSEAKILLEKAEALTNLTKIYRLLGNYPKALESGLEALKVYTTTKNEPKAARLLTNLGNVYFRLEDYEEALEFHNESLQIARQQNDELGIAVALVNMGIVYENMNQIDKAMEFFFQALPMNRKLGLKLDTSINLENIGDLYLKQGRYDAALPYFSESLELSKEISDKQGIASISRHIAEIYQRKEEVQKSMNHAAFSYEIASKNKLKVEAAAACLILSQNHSYLRDYENALKFYELHKAYSDSLYNEANLNKLQKIENSYEIQQREQKLTINEQTIALLERDKQLSTLWRNILIVSLLMAVLAGFLISKFLKTNNRKDRALLEAQKANTRQLQELDKAKSQFFANISHEFRTPLTLIKGPIEQLERNPEERLSKESVKMIQRNANRILTLVNQLLDLSKIDEGSSKLEPTEGDIYKCLRTATSSFNSHAAQRNIDYRVKIPSTVLWASFDRDKLEKIMYNLLSNAFKFSEDGSSVVFNAAYIDQELHLLVTDRGRGISTEDLPFIFDRFYQADSSYTKEQEGSGIGLSLSKDLVKLMGGKITATSELDKGTSFNVHLPIQVIKTHRDGHLVENTEFELASLKRASFEFTKEDKRDLPLILLVEDNADMRHFIRENLVKTYKLEEATDGKEGLENAAAHAPDLIITDLMMPKMDGLELCKKLRANVHTSHIPVIMLTAKAGMKNRIEGLETGADDYLTKPFDAKELLVRIKNLIDQRQKLRELYSKREAQVDPRKITVTSIDQKFLEEVLELLENQYSNADFGPSQMQDLLAMSKTQLHRKLKALTNETPGELLRNFRLKRAAQLLSQKADSVTQIAYQVGFNNLSYFAKCFRELYGVAPSSY